MLLGEAQQRRRLQPRIRRERPPGEVRGGHRPRARGGHVVRERPAAHGPLPHVLEPNGDVAGAIWIDAVATRRTHAGQGVQQPAAVGQDLPRRARLRFRPPIQRARDLQDERPRGVGAARAGGAGDPVDAQRVLVHRVIDGAALPPAELRGRVREQGADGGERRCGVGRRRRGWRPRCGWRRGDSGAVIRRCLSGGWVAPRRGPGESISRCRALRREKWHNQVSRCVEKW